MEKRPHTLKSDFCAIFGIFFFFQEKNIITLLSWVFCVFFVKKNHLRKRPHTLKSCFFPRYVLSFSGKKQNYNALMHFYGFFGQKSHWSKRPHTLKSVFPGGENFLPQKYTVTSAFLVRKKRLVFFNQNLVRFVSKMLSNFCRILGGNLIFF